MADTEYLIAALGAAAAITVTLRAAPFAMKARWKNSAVLAEVGRAMPLGALTILAVYCLAKINLHASGHGSAEIAGVFVTVAAHLWRRNAVLSIVTGTATCLLIANGLIPA